jgi:hypothetical protein
VSNGDTVSQKGSAMEATARTRSHAGRRGLLRLAAVGLLAGTALVIPSISRGAHADVGYCRACGRFSIVPGPQVGFSTFVPDSADSVQSIDYTIHLPPGTRMGHPWFVGDLSGDISISVQNDAPRGTYSIDTDVVTDTSDTTSTQTYDGAGATDVGFGVTNRVFSVHSDT